METSKSVGCAPPLAIALISLCALAGCGNLPGFDSSPSFKSGEAPSYTIGSISRHDKTINDKGEEIVTKKELAKLSLTQPTNSSAYIFLPQKGPADTIACVTPAAAGLTQGVMSVKEGTLTVADKGGVTAKNTEGVSQGMLVLTSVDMANQYLANASFANCLAFASGMVHGPTAGKNLKEYILKAGDIALKLAEAKPDSERPESKMNTPAPSTGSGGAAPAPSAGASAAGSANKPSETKPDDRKSDATTSPMFDSMRGRPVLIR